MKRSRESKVLSILDRYTLKEFALNLVLILLSLILLYIIVDFFQRIRMFLSNDAALVHMVLYFFYSIPAIMVQMIPVSVLLSSLITFGLLSKNGELVAMKASGISLYRAAAGPVLFSLILAPATFLMSEYVAPQGNQRVKHTLYADIQNRPQLGEFKRHEIWYRGQAGIYNFSLFDPHRSVLRGVRIHGVDGTMHLTRRIDAATGRWRNGVWTLYDVMITTFPDDDFPSLEVMESTVIDIPETPKDFLVAQRDPDEMGFGELRSYIAKVRSEGYDATRYRVGLHGKAAFPFVSIIMALLGMCFAARFERSGGIAQGIGIGILTGLSYWLLFAFAMSLGQAGTFPPFFAAWAANIVFLVLALLMLTRVRT